MDPSIHSDMSDDVPVSQLLSVLVRNSQSNQQVMSDMSAMMRQFMAMQAAAQTAPKPESAEKETRRSNGIPKLNVPDFQGVPGDEVEDWLRVFDLNCGAAGIPKEERTAQAVSYFRGSAAIWFERYSQSVQKIPHYDQFRSDMIAQFQRANVQHELRKKLRSLSQKGSLDKYIQEFDAIAWRIIDSTEIDKVYLFLDGLTEKLSSAIGYQKPQTLEAAMRMARDFDSFQGCGQPTATAPTPMDIYHSKENSQSQFKGKCFNCGAQGHLKADCKVKKESQSQPKKDKKSRPTKRNYHVQDDGMVEVETEIAGRTAEFIVDSGASTSLISVQDCKRLGLQVSKENRIKIETIVGSGMSEGWTDVIPVTVHNSTVKLKMMVVNSKVNLLGLDWLTLTGAVLNTSEGTIQFPARKVYFGKTTTEDDVEELDYAPTNPEVDGDFMESNDMIEVGWQTSTPNWNAMVSADLRGEERGKILDLLKKYKDIFAFDSAEVTGAKVPPVQIRLRSGEPVATRMRRYSAKERAQLTSEVNKMLKEGIIRPSISPFQANCLLVPKKNTAEPRFCVDYRPLNANTLSELYPLPRIDDILDSLSGSRVFSKMDLKSGYWQLPLHKEAMAITAFSVPDGHYEFTRLPFGLKNAPAIFMRMMDSLLKDIEGVKVYLDDITPYSRSFEDHLVILQKIFDILRAANLKLNPTKCQFGLSKLEVFGFEVFNGHIRPLTSRVKAINRFPVPRTQTELRRFLGLSGYFRRFIRDYAKICTCLYGLLKDNVPWDFNDQCVKAFNLLKAALKSEEVLSLPDPTRTYRLYTDASGIALGAILIQFDAKSDREFVISYGSRKLTPAESNYGITELECLAVLWAIKSFRNYLHGQTFDVFTDHQALKWLLTTKELTGRLARWSMYLQDFDMHIHYKPGHQQAHVDALSRNAEQNSSLTFCSMVFLSSPQISFETDVAKDGPLQVFVKTRKHASGISRKTRNRVEREATKFTFENNQFWTVVNGRKLLVPEVDQRGDLVIQAHLFGHFGSEATYNRLKENVYWPKMFRDVMRICKSCAVCHRHNDGPRLDSLARPTIIGKVFEKVGMDLVLGFPEDPEGFIGCLVLTEYLTKFPVVYPIKTKTADEIARHLLEYISFFGPPEVIVSDQGTEFVNDTVRSLLTNAGIEARLTSAYNPRANGHTERFNKTLVNILKKLSEDQPTSWRSWLPFAVLAYRSKTHSSTRVTPFELLYGVKMRPFSVISSGEEGDDLPFEEDLQNRMKQLRDLLLQRTSSVSRLMDVAASQAANQNKRSTFQRLEEGSLVYRRMPKREKLTKMFVGPFQIVRQTKSGNYVLRNISTGLEVEQSVPISKLKPITSNSELDLSDEEPIEFEIDRILDHKEDPCSKEMWFLVKWKNYGDSENSWVRESDCHADELIAEYWASSKAREM